MLLNNSEELQKYFSDDTLVKLLSLAETEVFDAIRNKNNPYHLEYIQRININGKEVIKKVEIANFLHIIRSLIVDPVIEDIIYHSTKSIFKLRNKYHLYPNNNESIFSGIPKISKDKSLDFAFSKTAKTLEYDVQTELQKNNEKYSSRYLFLAKTKQNSFQGINIESFVWNKVGHTFSTVVENYLKEKYAQLPKSTYFTGFNTLEYLPGVEPYTFLDANIRLNKRFGVFSDTTKKPKNHSFSQDVAQLQLNSRGQELFEELSAVISNKILDEIYLAKDCGKKDFIKNEEEIISFDYYNCVRQFLPFDFQRDLLAWINGFYFNKEGIYKNKVGTFLIQPKKISLSTDYLDTILLKDFAKSIWDTITDQVSILKNNSTLSLQSNYLTTFYAQSNPRNNRSQFPQREVSLQNFSKILYSELSNSIQKNLPLPVKIQEDNLVPGEAVFMYSDKSGIGWLNPNYVKKSTEEK